MGSGTGYFQVCFRLTKVNRMRGAPPFYSCILFQTFLSRFFFIRSAIFCAFYSFQFYHSSVVNNFYLTQFLRRFGENDRILYLP
jgi:hypothetical protein